MTGSQIATDWYNRAAPENIVVGSDAYIETTYSFAGFNSKRNPGLILGHAAGLYDRASLVVGSEGRVTIGDFTILNGTTLVCNDRIDIGNHCLLAWGVVISDTWTPEYASVELRRNAIMEMQADVRRHLPSVGTPRPVIIEDNVWVGFDAVILPGVTLGRGCIVGCKSVVFEDVPPDAVVAGAPARLIR